MASGGTAGTKAGAGGMAGTSVAGSSSGGGGAVAGPDDRVLYPNGRVHSPITATVATWLRKIATSVAGRKTNSFIKLGDANSQGVEYMGCAQEQDRDLGAHALLDATIKFFAAGTIAGKNPFLRESVATRENLTSWDLLTEGWLPQEVTAANPSYALVMFGSVDLGDGGTLDPSPAIDSAKFTHYGEAMLDITDQLIERGVIPILRTMPRQEGARLAAQGATFNALTRAIAEGRQIPFIDFYSEMLKATDSGLSDDGLHINAYDGGLCVFTDAGLRYGYNIMNLVSLQALDRARAVVADSAPEIDASATTLVGSGSASAPFEVPALPFTDLRDLSRAPASALADYSTCRGGAGEDGGEYVYRLELTSPVRARVVAVNKSNSTVAARLHHFVGSAAPADCKASNNTMIEGSFAAGSHYFVVDSRRATAAGAEYVLVMVECDATDSTCG